ncbi:hypothetical protein ACR6C2_40320 [Streptomyces sp. INA 01156]
MRIYEDDSEPSFERRLAARLEGLAPASARRPSGGAASCATAAPAASRDDRAQSGSTSTGSARPCWNGRTATTTCGR